MAEGSRAPEHWETRARLLKLHVGREQGEIAEIVKTSIAFFGS